MYLYFKNLSKLILVVETYKTFSFWDLMGSHMLNSHDCTDPFACLILYFYVMAMNYTNILSLNSFFTSNTVIE
jgi:hypothetical protein